MGKKKQTGQGREKILHGNGARIDPGKDVTSLYAANAVTLPNQRDGGSPELDKANVESARHFSEENKK